MGKMIEYVIHGKPELGAAKRESDIPQPGPKEVLIKVAATGLNPKDWKWVGARDASKALNAGDDMTGTVEAVGSSVYEFKPGDRVGAFHVMGAEHGTYAEYAIAPASTTFPLPPNVSLEAGAGLPLSFMTAALGLYQHLGLPLPSSTVPVSSSSSAGAEEATSTPILIYGGASAVGAYALQLAKLSGLGPIITVAGAGADFVRSLSAADHIIDYRGGADVAGGILGALGGRKLRYAFDAISGKGSWAVISDVLLRSGGPGGRLNMVDPPTDPAWQWPEGVTWDRTFVASAYAAPHSHRNAQQAAKDGEFAFWMYRYMAYLLAEGKLQPHPIQVLEGGLDGVLDGVKALKDGKVSAKKLVARIADTPGL